MKTRFLIVAVGSAVVAAAAPAAQAQVPEWAEQPPPRLPQSMSRTLDHYRYFTDCIASREWVTARPLFDTPPGSIAEHRALDRILGGDNRTECSYALQMRMTSMLMRGGIAESRYRLVDNRAEVSAPNSEPAPVPAGASFRWVDFGRESGPAAQSAFARCLAEREGGAVHAVLVTPIGRREERAAWQALSRRFGSCLQPGQQLQANSLTLRPWLAEAQYQLLRRRQPEAD